MPHAVSGSLIETLFLPAFPEVKSLSERVVTVYVPLRVSGYPYICYNA